MDRQEFELEDILQEFTDHPEAYQRPALDDTRPIDLGAKPDLGDTRPIDLGAKPNLDETRPITKPGDTIRLDKITKVAKTAPADMGDTAPFQPVKVYEPQGAEKDAAQQVEPFSEAWEPEYEEPIEEFSIPEPIIFRPKSRLKELRTKLVEGPEKLYYSLTKQGLGRLQISMFLCLLIFLFCAGFTAMYAWGKVPQDRLQLLVFVQFLGMLLSALLGSNRLMEGLGDLLRMRFTVNTLLVCSFCVCCLDAVLCLQQVRIPISAAFSWEMFVAILSAYYRRSTLIGETDTLRRATNLDSVVAVPDWYHGQTGCLNGRGEVEHYTDWYAQPSTPERVLDWYALSVLLVGLIVGIMGGIRHGFSMGVQVCAAALLMGMPATAFLANCRPKYILEKQLHRLGTVLCGWHGVKTVKRGTVVPLDDSDMFPVGAAKLNGVKFYGDRDRDEVVEYATALIRANGGTLEALFAGLLESRSGYEYSVENLNCYGNGGIGGEIQGEAVLVGTLQFMTKMGVFMDEGTRIDRAVYCAIDGELCGVFAVTYGKAKSSVAGMRTLCGCGGLTPVAVCDDFMLTEEFIQSCFRVSTRRMVFPKREIRQELKKKELTGEETVVALTTKEGLAPRAFAVAGARVLSSAMKVGVAIHMVGGILGLLIMAALAWVGGAQILSASNILLYELVWMIPGILVTEWTHTL